MPSGVEAVSVDVLDVVRPLAEEACRELGLELWEISFSSNGRRRTLTVTCDRREGGVSLEDCEALSERLSALLDEADPISGPYLLDVGSPGLERRLRHLDDVARFLGERAKVIWRAGERRQHAIGWLDTVAGDRFWLRDERGERHEIPWADVQEAQLKPLFGKGDRR